MKSDSLVKCVSANQEAVIYALDATELVQETMERIDLWPPATKHLGQAMMATILLQALSDSEDSETLSLQWMCDGPFGHVYAEARNYGEVRGTIQRPHAEVADYETPLGPGLLQVRKARGVHAMTSVVSAVGVISTDVVEYLEKSEQKNCGINLSVLIDWEDEAQTKFQVSSALAYLVHVMPQPSEEKLNAALLRWDRQMQALGPISQWGLRPDSVTTDMLRLLTSEVEPKLVMNQRVIFSCNCTVERAARALALVEQHESADGTLKEIAEENIRCEYCGKTYRIAARMGKK